MTVQAPPAGPGAASAGTAAITLPVAPMAATAGARAPTAGEEPAPPPPRRWPAVLAGPVAGWLAVLAVAALPVLEAIRTGVQGGAVVLYGERALTDLAARRAWHLDQLVGAPTRFAFHQPGPAQAYLLAPWVRILEPSAAGVYLGATVVSGAALVAAVAVIWRRYGAPLALWAAAAIDWWCCCVHVGTLRDPAGTAMLVAPVVLLVVLWTAAISGTRGALMWAAVVASFEVQTHVATAIFCVAMLLVGAGAAMVTAGGDARLRLPYRWWRSPARPAGVVAFVLIWLPPVVELWRDDPNNVRAVWDFFTASHRTVGLHPALTAAATAASTLPFGATTPSSLVARGTVALVAFGAGLGLLTVVSVFLAYQRRSRAAYGFAAAAVVGAAAGVLSLTRAVGGVDGATAGWLAYVPLAVLLAVGAALLTPIGPPRVGKGFVAGVKAPFKWVKKHLPKRAKGLAARAKSDETAARHREQGREGKDGKKAKGKAGGKLKKAGAGAADRKPGVPALGWAAPSGGVVAALAVVAVVASGFAVRAERSTPSVRDAGSGAGSITARFAAAVEARLPPGTRTVGFTLVAPGSWVPVAGVIVALDDDHVQASVAPAIWTSRFGHERAPDRPVAARFAVYGATVPTRDRAVVLARADGYTLVAAPSGPAAGRHRPARPATPHGRARRH